MKAVEEYFGTNYRFQRDTHEAIDGAQVIERSRTLSKEVALNGFQEIEVKQEEIDDDRFNTAILFQWRKKDIASEKRRLDSSKPKQGELGAFEPVDTSPVRRPSSVSQGDVHKTVEASFAVGLGLGNGSTSIAETSNSVNAISLITEFRVFNFIGLNATGSYGSKSTKYTNGSLDLSRYSLGFGAPIFFKKMDRSAVVPYLSPGLKFEKNNFDFSGTGLKSMSSEKSQTSVSIDFGVQFRLTNEVDRVFSFRLQGGVARSVQNSAGITSANEVTGKIFLVREIFNK